MNYTQEQLEGAINAGYGTCWVQPYMAFPFSVEVWETNPELLLVKVQYGYGISRANVENYLQGLPKISDSELMREFGKETMRLLLERAQK